VKGATTATIETGFRAMDAGVAVPLLAVKFQKVVHARRG
jgi:hypothetical protein